MKQKDVKFKYKGFEFRIWFHRRGKREDGVFIRGDNMWHVYCTTRTRWFDYQRLRKVTGKTVEVVKKKIKQIVDDIYKIPGMEGLTKHEIVSGVYRMEKCPKCKQRTLKVMEVSDAIYGNIYEAKCKKCGYKESYSSPPRWIIEEGRPASGPGSRAPHGMGIRDEYGGL